MEPIRCPVCGKKGMEHTVFEDSSEAFQCQRCLYVMNVIPPDPKDPNKEESS